MYPVWAGVGEESNWIVCVVLFRSDIVSGKDFNCTTTREPSWVQAIIIIPSIQKRFNGSAQEWYKSSTDEFSQRVDFDGKQVLQTGREEWN